ncbi:MAG: hypothetical protein IT462_17250 [Planctomycetes bacterium]|nr:hypothetical protein [Planctomycetota bacterium]
MRKLILPAGALLLLIGAVLALAPRPAQSQPSTPEPRRLNHPRGGQLVLRVIDDDSGKALANTSCTMWPVRLVYHAAFAGLPPAAKINSDLGNVEFEESRDEHETTDNSGLIVTRRFLDDPQILLMTERPRTTVYPVPEGYEPVTSPSLIFRGILDAWIKPTWSPIDVRVRRMRPLELKLTDNLDVVSGAKVGAVLVIPRRGAADGLGDPTPAQREERRWGFSELALEYVMDEEDMEWQMQSLKDYRFARRAKVKASPPASAEDDPEDLRATIGDFLEEDGATHRAVAVNAGAYRFSALPTGEYAIFAYAPGHDVAVLRTPHPGGGPLELVLAQEDVGAMVHVTLHRAGDEYPNDEVNLRVSQSSPNVDEQTDDGPFVAWVAHHGGLATSTFEFGPLPAGGWRISISREDPEGPVYPGPCYVELHDGQTAQLDFYTGQGALAQFRAQARFGDQLLEEFPVLVRREGELHVDEITFSSSDREGVMLAPGEYIMVSGFLPPRRVLLRAGENRVEEFELPSRHVSFSISDELRELLLLGVETVTERPDPGDPSTWFERKPYIKLMLSLPEENTVTRYVADTPEFALMADGHLGALGDGAEIPAEGAAFDLMAGVYDWRLLAAEQEIGGSIDLRGSGDKAVRFGLDSLPGLAVGKVMFSGLTEEEFDEAEYFIEEAELRGRQVLGVDSEDTPGAFGPGGQSYEVKSGNKTVYVFGPPGAYTVVLDAPRMAHRCFMVPGSLDIGPELISEQGSIRLIADSDGKWFVGPEPKRGAWTADACCINAGGDAVQLDAVYGPDPAEYTTLPQGEYLLLIRRERCWDHPALGGLIIDMHEAEPEVATVRVRVGVHPIDITVNQLDFQPVGTLVIKATRACPAPTLRDFWWAMPDGGRMKVEALDFKTADAPLAAYPQLVPITTKPVPYALTEELLLPPGRYKITPWPGAPESACRTIDLKPGKREEVVFEGR